MGGVRKRTVYTVGYFLPTLRGWAKLHPAGGQSPPLREIPYRHRTSKRAGTLRKNTRTLGTTLAHGIIRQG